MRKGIRVCSLTRLMHPEKKAKSAELVNQEDWYIMRIKSSPDSNDINELGGVKI